jgi:DNA adenine methylase
MNKIERPVLRYHGGKFLLAPWIISHFPKHKVYTEVFGGAGSVLMQKPRSMAEIYNDRWDTVVNVFRILRDPVLSVQLARLLELTPYARTEFDSCGEIEISIEDDPLEKARKTILRSFAGFGSASTNAAHSTGFRAKSRNTFTTPAADWLSYPKNISVFTERLQGVTIENKDYREVLLQHDSPSCLHYLDPPYVLSTRNIRRGNANYVHEFSDQDHIEMAGIVEGLRGPVVISGYHCELYSDLFKKWDMVRKSTMADGAAPRVECLWLNDAAYLGMPKKELFT